MTTPKKFHTLGTVQLPRGMVWIDEHDWSPVEKATAYSTTGALLVDVAVRQAGRPITLQGEPHAGWMRRSVLDALWALAADPVAQHTLELADGRTFTVIFTQDPISAKPIARPELPPTHYPYFATLRLLEI